MTLEKKQVYIVDDDESVRRALKLLVEAYGFAVDAYTSSEAFFSAIPNSTRGCLILDLYMPGLNGWDALERLMRTGSNRPVIMITASKSEGLEEQALKAGAIGLLLKPFNDQELVDLIDLAFGSGLRPMTAGIKEALDDQGAIERSVLC